MATALAAASGMSGETALAVVRHQTTCTVCGRGMIVDELGPDVVGIEDQVVLADGRGHRVEVHGYCLPDPRTGAEIARHLGFGVPGR